MKLILALALAAGAAAVLATEPANYAGSWTLDAAHSTGLPDYYSRVKSHKLQIAQTPARLQVDVTVDAGQPEPDRINFVYGLDGVETVTATPIRGPGGLMQVPTKLKATVGVNGTVRIVITRTIAMGGPPMDAVTTEDWTLSEDHKTLTVHRVDDTPRGRVDAQMVFVRS